MAVLLTLNQAKPIRKIKLDLASSSTIEYLISNIDGSETVILRRVFEDLTDYDTANVVTSVSSQINVSLTQSTKITFSAPDFTDFAGGNLTNFAREGYFEFECLNTSPTTDIKLVIIGINKSHVIV